MDELTVGQAQDLNRIVLALEENSKMMLELTKGILADVEDLKKVWEISCEADDQEYDRKVDEDISKGDREERHYEF